MLVAERVLTMEKLTAGGGHLIHHAWLVAYLRLVVIDVGDVARPTKLLIAVPFSTARAQLLDLPHLLLLLLLLH